MFFSARLNHFVPIQNQGLYSADLPLVISVAGEIGNNSFDHNLGQWRDQSGCWFEFQLTKHRLWVLIADRGQGIFQSLHKIYTDILNSQIAVETAFKKNISGRAPEQRGNGLKFVKDIMSSKPGRGLVCASCGGYVDFGDLGKDCANVLVNLPQRNFGTTTLFVWEIK